MTAFDHRAYAEALARAVALVRRSPGPGEAQKNAVREVLAFTERKSVTVRYYDGVLTIDDVEMPLGEPPFAALVERLRAQAINEIIIARGAIAPEIVALVRGLAADAGQGRLKDKLRDAGSTKVMVILESHEPAQRARPSVSDAFARAQMDDQALAEWNKFLSGRAESGAERRLDLGFEAPAAPADPSLEVVLPPPAPPAAPPPHAPAAPPAPAAPAAPAPPARQVAVEPPAASLPQPRTLETASPLGTALAKVLRDPYGPDLLTRLTPLERQILDAIARDRMPEAIDALNALVDLEARAPTDQTRGSYAVILRRVLTHATLTQLTPYALDAKRGGRATAILRRGGEDAVALLTGLVATAQSPGERAAYLQVVKGIPRAVDRVIALLSRSEWQVVRNVAEALGDVRVEEAVTYLVRLLEHEDVRVQRTALVALARIGTSATAEPLRRILREGAPEQRALIAANVTGPHARALALPLVAALDAEGNADVARECARALGRIASTEAVRALAKAAEPGGKLIGRKSASARLAAVEGLRLAGDAGRAALEALAEDGDRAVREAVRAALRR
jgi:hypothetical protein